MPHPLVHALPPPPSPPRFTFSANAVTGTGQTSGIGGRRGGDRPGRAGGPGVRVWAQDSPSWAVLACRSHCKRVQASATFWGPGMRSGLGGSRGPGGQGGGKVWKEEQGRCLESDGPGQGPPRSLEGAVRGPCSPARPALLGRGWLLRSTVPIPKWAPGSAATGPALGGAECVAHRVPGRHQPVCLSWQTVRDPWLPAPALATPGTCHYL